MYREVHIIWPRSRLCSAIAISSNLPMACLLLTVDRKVSIITAYMTEEPDETLASRPVLMTNRSREGAICFHRQFLVEASVYAAFPPPSPATVAMSISDGGAVIDEGFGWTA
jgi:hypothetical protein